MKNKNAYLRISKDVNSISKAIFSTSSLAKSQDLEYFVEFSLIKRYSNYEKKINSKTGFVSKLSSTKHFETFLTSYIRLVTIEELEEDLQDYKDFIQLNKDLYFKKYDYKKEATTGNPIRFFFELLSFLFFKNKSLINEETYKINFSDTYEKIMRTKLGKNNPNAKSRFEIAYKVIMEHKNGYNLFNS